VNGFRVARTAPPAWNVAKTLGHTAVFWTVFLFLLPAAITAGETALGLSAFQLDGQRVLGGIMFASCGALGLTSGAIMAIAGKGTPLPLDSARRLVMCGPYRYVRNPMAVAGIGQGVAVGIWLGSWPVIAYAVAGGAIWHWIIRPLEERDLVQRFGEPYERYRAAVRCWLPRMGSRVGCR
jgi:protein-S-isoprenylcysteine O-methyltransferase Ste14